MIESPLFEKITLTKFPELDQSFLFTSGWQSLLTDGCFQRISAPLLDSQGRQDNFHQELQRAFKEARAAGIDNPRLVGAIPFDSQQPAALFIPEQVSIFSREYLLRYCHLAPQTLTIEQRDEIPGKSVFTRMVADAVDAMNQGKLDKVVLSRLLRLTTRQKIDISTLMAQILRQNPTNYHFHVPLVSGERLVGASPELLLRKQGHYYRSCPLAGSARRQTDPSADQQAGEDLMNSGKDLYEHHLVTEAMHTLLAPLSAAISVPASPRLVSTPTLWHLATEIKGCIAHAGNNALNVAGLLHPTPALSGFPHQNACDLINTLEPFSRQLFGGMVGWCDDHGNGEWVVTIRCATIAPQHVTLFAGAGIVPASIPEAEWQETGTKLSTMLKPLGLD